MRALARVVRLGGFACVLAWFAGRCLEDGRASVAEMLLGAGLAWCALCLAAVAEHDAPDD